MTVPLTSDGTFEREFSGNELEVLMGEIRETAQTATGAAATCILLLEDQGTKCETLLALTSAGPVDRALHEFCRLSRRPSATEAQPAFEVGRPCPSRQVTLHGSDYVMFAIPFSGNGIAASGLLGLAMHASGSNLQHIAEVGARLARCAELFWATHDGMSGLAYEVLTLANRASRLQRIAEIDPLTQIENSSSFEEKVRAKLDSGMHFAAFIVLDIDHFKLINDLYGHQFGDVYLKTIARALRSAFPEGSIVGRLGGDEFGILTPLPTAGRSYLEALLSRCRSGIQRSTALLGKPDLGKVSIGASQYPDHGDVYTTLYDHADAALYAAKDSGRSLSAVFHPNHHESYNSTELAKRFRTAVANGDIRPHFQPVVSLTDGSCAGFEILARWRSEGGRHLEPSEFSAIFRDHAMAEKMTRTVMHRAFQDYAASVKPTGLRLRLSLNVTFFDLMNPEFAFEVQHAVADTGFDWSLLTIEVTEQTMLGEQSGQIFRSLNELRARGAQIALDDFGTGYGGLRHIANWPIDTLKIDKFFVDGLAGEERDRAVFEAVMSMSQKLGYTVIAEGIETQQQIAALQSYGCGYAQGYAFDRPLTGEGLRDFRQSYDLASRPATSATARDSTPR